MYHHSGRSFDWDRGSGASCIRSQRGRVVITQDVDFLRLHAEGTPHAGIVFWRQQTRSIGEVRRRVLLIHATMSPDDMKNRVEYL